MTALKLRIVQVWIPVFVVLGVIHLNFVHYASLDEPSQQTNQPKKDESNKMEPVRLDERICADWDTNMDSWWTHHPDYEVSHENETGYCFSPIEDKRKADFFRHLYEVQYKSNCSNARTVKMASNGWGATFNMVDKGLLYAYENNQPIAVHPNYGRWHYAAKKDASKPVCPRKDMSCYFLNVTSCQANPDKTEDLTPKGSFSVNTHNGRWAYQYATRGQTWLRREVYQMSSSTKLTTPCTVMHVRRTDVALEKGKGKQRTYHSIQEYVEGAGTNLTENIFLLTDDQNAIDEATTEFPQYNWMFLDRPRYRGIEGGYEGHIPSDDPKFEVVVILATLQLVKHCETFVYANSRFATQIKTHMLGAKMVNLD